ncbi:MAG: hypothetical protein ACYCPR_04105 [Thermoplasmataceae archaeon]|nr:hypothetical protein [Candidatus Thermoplasmatota archaeon]
MKIVGDRVAKNVLKYEANIFGFEYRRFMMIILAVIISALIFRLNLYLSVAFLLLSMIFLIARVNDRVLGTVMVTWARKQFSGTEGILNNTYELHEMKECIFSLYDNTISGIVEISSPQFHSVPGSDTGARDNGLRLILNKLDCSVEFISVPHEPDLTGLLPRDKGELEQDYAGLLRYSFSGIYYLKNYVVLKYPVTARGFHEAATMAADGIEKLRRDLSSLGFTVHKIDSRPLFIRIFSSMV